MLQVQLEVGTDPAEVGRARRWARSRLTGPGTGVDDALADTLILIVSELVTNALRHALPADQPRGRHDPAVRLHLMRWTSRLVCAVRDPSHDSPVARDSDDFSAECGRGLFLVDSFSDSWGWHPLAGAALSGKVVWALFRLQPQGAAAPTSE